MHSAEVCPTSNEKTRDLLLKLGPEIPAIAERTGVNLVSGPFVNREHTVVAVVESDRADKVDRFLIETRLPQWNQIRLLPSLPMEEAMKEVQDARPLF
jgi:uncharacterized protein with GYD domain